MIGLLGVLYDVAIGQAVAVEELFSAGKHLTHAEIYKTLMCGVLGCERLMITQSGVCSCDLRQIFRQRPMSCDTQQIESRR